MRGLKMFQETKKKRVVISAAKKAPLREVPRRHHAQREGFVETSDQQALHYTVYGERGPWIALCDGVGCDGYIWKYLAQDLSEDCRLLHWQYRGHGQSQAPRDYVSLTVEQMTKDLKAVIDRIVGENEPVILAGHSMGVQVILEFHRNFPQQVRALIPICGAPGNTLEAFMNSNVMSRIFPHVLEFFRSLPMLSGWVWNHVIATPQGYYPALALQLTSTMCSKADLQPYLDHLARMDARVFMELTRDMSEHSAEDHLPQINIPTLVFVGERDNFTPLAKSRVVADKIPGAELCIVRGGTHTAPLELPRLMILRIRKFLQERLKV